MLRGRPVRRFLSIAVFIWIASLALQFSRGYLDGPAWGLALAPSQLPGEAVARSVAADSLAWIRGVRVGDRVTAVNGEPASLYVDNDLHSALEISAVTARGPIRIEPPVIPPVTRLLLLVAAFTFVALGALVYRWAIDGRVGLLFLIIGTGFSTALVSIPDAQLGYRPPVVLTALSAIVAGSAFFLLNLYFPHPVRWAGRASRIVTVGVLSIFAMYFASILLTGTVVGWVDTVLAASFSAAVLLGLLALVSRGFSAADRSVLAPIAIGSAVALLPVTFLNAVPRAIGVEAPLRVELAVSAATAIPLSFAYAILRHRLFALDAIVRARLIEITSVVVMVTFFFLGWRLSALVMDTQAAALVAAAVIAAVSPFVWERVRRVIDAWLYRSLWVAQQSLEGQGSESLAHEGAVRIRDIVPVQWAAVFGRVPDAAPNDPSHLLLGTAGDTPSDLSWGNASVLARGFQQVENTGKPVGTLAVGPRIDGLPLGSVEMLALATLARQVAAPLEAALLRELAEEENLFREGLTTMARDLAGAATVYDVLQVAARYSRNLVGADQVDTWLRDPRGTFRSVHTESEGVHEGSLTDLFGAVVAARLGSQQVARPDSGSGERYLLVLRIGDAQGAGAIRLQRGNGVDFSNRDVRRLTELSELTGGAFNRATVAAQAAEADTLRELDRVRTELLDIVTHDLQSPLTIIGGYAEMLETHATTLDSQATTRMASEITRAQRSAIRLVDDLLTTAKQERGRLSLHPEAVELQGFLEKVLTGFSVVGGNNQPVLKVAEPLWVSADPVRLEQIVANFVSNAFRYAPDSLVQVGAEPMDNNEIRVFVQDGGPGIAEDEQAKVWDKFYRSEQGRRIARGTGIGLSVVKTLAELQGGRAELHSEVGKGSRFSIVLPQIPSPNQERTRLKLLA